MRHQLISLLALSCLLMPPTTTAALPAEEKGSGKKGSVPFIEESIKGTDPFSSNALGGESSPYLLQHAANPVNWQPWSEAAFKQAEATGKPVFLSIGYSTCHWCHVMARESFSDAEVAEVLNEHFVSIKVDREELPHIDQYYTDLTTELKGSAGWPLSILLNADGSPLFLDSYLPKEELLSLLRRIADLAAEQPELLAQNAAMIASLLNINSEEIEESGNSEPLTEAELESLTRRLLQTLDPIHGGVQGRQKFPREPMLLFLLSRLQWSDDPQLRSAIDLQLQQMARGGLYDPVHGGFFRYATAPNWAPPHFEKMLYNQALLLGVYDRAADLTGEPFYRWISQDIGHFLDNWLADEAGYFAAIDAIYQGVEGGFYLWTQDELNAQLGEGRSLNVYDYGGEVAPRLNDEGHSLDEALRLSLRKQKALSTRPFIDHKIITAWNGATLASLSRASCHDEMSSHNRIESTAEHLWQSVFDPATGRVARNLMDGATQRDGSLEDYAYLLLATLALYDCGASASWLQRSQLLADSIQSGFLNPEGDFRLSQVQVTHAPGDTTRIRDTELPAADAVAVQALWQLNKRSPTPALSRSLRPAVNTLRAKFRARPEANLYAAKVLQAIDLGDRDESQYFAQGKGLVSWHRSESDCGLGTLAVALAPGWHINSNTPLQDYLKPTQVTPLEASGDSLSADYPSARRVALGFQSEELSVFDGDFEIALNRPGVNECHQRPGTAVSLQLQACSDEICLAPESLQFYLPPAD